VRTKAQTLFAMLSEQRIYEPGSDRARTNPLLNGVLVAKDRNALAAAIVLRGDGGGSDDRTLDSAIGEAIQPLHVAFDRAYAVGFPDLHPGKAYPIGASFVSRGVMYPLLAGNDIGCAMSFWKTDQPVRKVKLERLSKRLDRLEFPWEGDR